MRLPHGQFGWVDLMSSDVEASRAFYAALFGWTSVDMATPMGPVYTNFYRSGKRVAGMGPQPPEMAAAGVPSQWNSYVIVDSVDDVTKGVEAAGGSVVMPAMDVMTEGRLAMVADPTGAVVGLWQPQAHQGSELFDVPGAPAWNELMTRDVDRAMRFYTDVFGWRWERTDDEVEYYIGNLDTKAGDDKSNCGAMPMPPLVPAEAPNVWMVYIAVADCDAAVELAQVLGAEVFFAAREMGPGRFAGITDPSGAMLMLGSFYED
jgi:predicted enzyme related to lactoylglutathione lyase